ARMRAIERVTSKLPRVRHIRDGVYRADCPACGGGSGSKFSIKSTENGVLVYCFGGCSLESILGSLGMRSAAELFDAVDYKPDPEIQRRRRIQRGLEIWTQRRLIYVCENLRHIEAGISAFAEILTETGIENEDVAETLSRLYKHRSDLDWEFH